MLLMSSLPPSVTGELWLILRRFPFAMRLVVKPRVGGS